MKPPKKIFAALFAALIVISFCLSAVCADVPVNIFDSGINFNCDEFYMVNVDTDTVVIDRNSKTARSPASVTKLTTALLAAEAIERGDITFKTEITAEYDDFNDMVSDGSTAGISKGETINVEQLIYCMLVGSANEAANILARCVSGSIEQFVAQMNERTKELGCVNSHYINPHGLTDKNTGIYNTSCAYDIALIMRELIKYDYVTQAMRTPSYTLNTNKHTNHVVRTTNYLLDESRSPIKDGKTYEYEYLLGGKTGYTEAAGACFASYAQKDGMTYICVALGGLRESKYDTNYAMQDTRSAYIWAFDSLAVRSLVDTTFKESEVKVTLSFDAEYVSLLPASDIKALIPSDFDTTRFQKSYDIPESIEAPVTKGQKVGTMSLIFAGTTLGTVDLIADKDIQKSATLGVVDKVEGLFSEWWFWAIVGGAAALIILYIAVAVIVNLRRRRSKKRNMTSYRRKAKRVKGRRYK